MMASAGDCWWMMIDRAKLFFFSISRRVRTVLLLFIRAVLWNISCALSIMVSFAVAPLAEAVSHLFVSSALKQLHHSERSRNLSPVSVVALLLLAPLVDHPLQSAAMFFALFFFFLIPWPRQRQLLHLPEAPRQEEYLAIYIYIYVHA